MTLWPRFKYDEPAPWSERLARRWWTLVERIGFELSGLGSKRLRCLPPRQMLVYTGRLRES